MVASAPSSRARLVAGPGQLNARPWKGGVREALEDVARIGEIGGGQRRAGLPRQGAGARRAQPVGASRGAGGGGGAVAGGDVIATFSFHGTPSSGNSQRSRP